MRIRTRLTLLYAVAFFLAGAILIALTYVNLRQSLESRPGTEALVEQFVGRFGGLRNFPVLDSLFGAMAAQAEQDRADTLNSMLLWSLVSLCLVGVAAVGFGWLLAGRALQPLQAVTATARRVADRNLHERIWLAGPDDEIKELADTFDAMLERLDRSFDGQHRFVANASHELRTPLAINRTLIEVALEDPATPEATRSLGRSLLAVNQRQERLIDGLLVLASSEQHLDTHAPVDLGEVAERAVRAADAAARGSGISVQVELDRPAPVSGDPALLERLAGNLVDNAVRYNVRDGWVGVVVTTAGGRARLTVQNTGPVIADDDVEGLFEPFRRLHHGAEGTESPAAAGGTGLGLSIVRSVAAAHGGGVRAMPRPQGGLLVEVEIPLSPPRRDQ